MGSAEIGESFMQRTRLFHPPLNQVRHRRASVCHLSPANKLTCLKSELDLEAQPWPRLDAQAAYCAIAYKDASAYRLAHHRFGAKRAPMAERRAVLPLEDTGTTVPMPRYFFHVTDGADYPGSEGIILDDVATARAEAITTAGALLWGSGEWRMTVIDEAGATVCRLRFAAE
jgi:uncharacterized protein DUF6894